MSAATFWSLPRPQAPLVDPRALPAFRLIAVQAAAVALLIACTGFGYDGRDIDAVAALIAAAIAAGAGLRWYGIARLATAIEAMALILASSLTVACLSILVASWAPPLADRWLAAADRTLFPFLSWRDMALALAPHACLVHAMCAIYATLLWQPFVLAAALALAGREAMAWRFVQAWLLALAICVAIFAIAPAVTPYVYYGIAPGQTPALTVNAGWRPAELLGHVRDGSLHVLASGSMSGMITFPSFHAAGAVLLGWGFRRVPVVGWAFVAFDGVMLATIPLIGSHYFVDVLGGVAVAAVAIVATRRAQ